MLLPDGGGIGLIGPGAARTVPRERIDFWITTLEALGARDEAAFASSLSDEGLLPEDAARAAYGEIEYALGPLLLTGGPTVLDDDALAAAGDRALDRLDTIVSLVGQATPDPADLWPLRMLAQLAALLGPLGAEEDWLELALGALRDGWR